MGLELAFPVDGWLSAIPAVTLDMRKADENSRRKWLFTWSLNPAYPALSAPGMEPMSIALPSGKMMRCQATNTRDCPYATSLE